VPRHLASEKHWPSPSRRDDRWREHPALTLRKVRQAFPIIERIYADGARSSASEGRGRAEIGAREVPARRRSAMWFSCLTTRQSSLFGITSIACSRESAMVCCKAGSWSSPYSVASSEHNTPLALSPPPTFDGAPRSAMSRALERAGECRRGERLPKENRPRNRFRSTSGRVSTQ
jgi:hypothetical protein